MSSLQIINAKGTATAQINAVIAAREGGLQVQWTYADMLLVTTLPDNADVEAEIVQRMAAIDEELDAAEDEAALQSLVGEVV